MGPVDRCNDVTETFDFVLLGRCFKKVSFRARARKEIRSDVDVDLCSAVKV